MTRPVCAIVGAGEGLGRALAARFAGENCDIGLVSRSREGSRAAAEAAFSADPEAKVDFFAADARQPETVERALNDVASEIGEVEVLIYNARGEFTRREPLDMTYAELEEVYRVEVVGAFAAARSVLPAMRRQGAGSVMFSSATAAFRGSATHPLCAIGKFGLRALSQSLAKAYSIAHYRSSHLLTRSFCGTCGSVVPYPSEARDHIVSLGGCHDRGKKSDCNIFVAHNAPWHDITGPLPRHDDYPPETGYPRVEEEPLPPGPEGVVRGSCMCGAIEFHLTEPFKLVHNCHCSRCRRARAAAHATNGLAAMDAVRFVRGEDHLKSYKLPEPMRFTQVFCDVCGSKMPRIDPDRGIAIVPLGALDDDRGRRRRTTSSSPARASGTTSPTICRRSRRGRRRAESDGVGTSP